MHGTVFFRIDEPGLEKELPEFVDVNPGTHIGVLVSGLMQDARDEDLACRIHVEDSNTAIYDCLGGRRGGCVRDNAPGHYLCPAVHLDPVCKLNVQMRQYHAGKEGRGLVALSNGKPRPGHLVYLKRYGFFAERVHKYDVGRGVESMSGASVRLRLESVKMLSGRLKNKGPFFDSFVVTKDTALS